jgi:AcrR family transcriptional regulator
VSHPSSASLARVRGEDSGRRRRRVLKALDDLGADGHEISVSAVARRAGVHRSLIYRHTDLHAAVLARAAQPDNGSTGPQVSRKSLLADLANLTERNTRMARRITQLERRLSETIGQDTWRESGLGAPPDVDAAQQRAAELEQEVADLRTWLADRGDELAAARTANRELMVQLNAARPTRG